MIPLTVANSLDQSLKQRIEVQSQSTVKQAISDAKLAPKGQFDVFDDLGKVVSNLTVDQFRDKTIYIGVQKVAGGAIQFDDDWGEGIDLDEIDQPARKVITLINMVGVRQEVEPRENETLIQAAERAGLSPRDGSPIEVRDMENDIVSNRRAKDMIGRSFRVNMKAVAGGGKYSRKRKAHVPIVPKEIIEQTIAFTAPRGRLEMGGLLIGHVNEKDENVVVCGFFPEQSEASPGYCEFEGRFVAMAAAACDIANERCGGPHTPNLRVIGWIHTHPDIGIFLSGIDVTTFTNLRDMSQDGRCVAVVVDPLRQEHGVFRSPRSANNRDSEVANGRVNLSEDLQSRYHKFIDRMRFMQIREGHEGIPMIMPGNLRRERIAMADIDDIELAQNQALNKMQRDLNSLGNNLKRGLETHISSLQISVKSSNQNLITLERKMNSSILNQKKEIDNHGEKFQTLVDSQQMLNHQIETLANNQNKLNEQIGLLAQNQTKIDEHLNGLEKGITNSISKIHREIISDAEKRSANTTAKFAELEQLILDLKGSKKKILVPNAL